VSPAEVLGVAPLQTAGAAVPSLVAIALAGLLYGRQGLRQLFGGFRRWRVGARWYLTAIFLAPLLTVVALGVRALLDGDFAVDPDSSLGTELAAAGLTGLLVSLPVVFVVSLVTSPLLEEPGWRGFALPHLQDRLTALAAGVLLGFLEGLWQQERGQWRSSAPTPSGRSWSRAGCRTATGPAQRIRSFDELLAVL
jgi:uncharacterized protein